MILLLDLDNVVRDASWREGLITSENWDAYHQQGINDKPIDEIISLVKSLKKAGWMIVIVTGCSDDFRSQVMAWLVTNQVPVYLLLMRNKGDFRPTPEVKLELVGKYFNGRRFEEFIIIDDREDICTTFREAGITALQCYKRARPETTKPVGTNIKQEDDQC